MLVGARRLVAVAAGATALLAVGLVLAAGSEGAAGLRVDTLRLDGVATAGAIGRVTVSNPSSQTIKLTMTPRRWTQRRGGQLLPNARKSAVIKNIKVSSKSFTLKPGAKRIVSVALKATPAAHYLYAALVARGVPKTKKSGVRPIYQIAIAVSLRPPASRQRFRQRASSVRVRKRKKGGVLVDVLVRNRGNMVTPPTGTITITRAKTTRTVKIPARVGVLPKGRVRLPAVVVRGLHSGRYRVKVAVQQTKANGQGAGRATATGRFRLTHNGRVTR